MKFLYRLNLIVMPCLLFLNDPFATNVVLTLAWIGIIMYGLNILICLSSLFDKTVYKDIAQRPVWIVLISIFWLPSALYITNHHTTGIIYFLVSLVSQTAIYSKYEHNNKGN